jgi:hypothetical protein
MWAVVQCSDAGYFVTGVCGCMHRLREQKDGPDRVAIIVTTKLPIFVTLARIYLQSLQLALVIVKSLREVPVNSQLFLQDGNSNNTRGMISVYAYSVFVLGNDLATS